MRKSEEEKMRVTEREREVKGSSTVEKKLWDEVK